MYLKRLEIQGFKSFANKTVLDFLAPKNGINSVTAIVGPNGSGKSNVTDAIRWVMGEQSMKHVRAKKSEDVIFNGSEARGAQSFAEVTMVMDNSARPHPASPEQKRQKTVTVGVEDFQPLQDAEEITLTRRLYRNGESEYLVNNNQARLLDIHLLLARLKFAEGAYSIVSQGMIDRLLTVTNSERKDFFDEACGIKEYQIKQHQAELKLARTEENMREATTLMAEVEPRLKILARQVKKLEQRHEVEAKLVEHQEKYYLTLYTKNKIEIESIRQKLQAVGDRYKQSFELLEKTQTDLATLAHAASRQEVFDDLQRRHQEATRAKNEMERQLIIIEGQMQTEYSQAGKQNVGWLENKARELKNNHDRLSGIVKAAEAEAGRHEVVMSEQKKKIETLGLEQTQLKLKISRLQSQLMQNQSEQSYLQLSGLTAVKAILEARNQFGGKVYGLVAELGEVEEAYRLALEVAAGANLSSIVVENEQVARKAIEYLRENRFGVATFLPLNKIQSRGTYSDTDQLAHQNGVRGKAIDLVRYDTKFENIFSMIFGSTLVVEDLVVAERVGIGRARMVTLDGDVVEYKGVMRGGFRHRRGGLSFSSKLSLSGDDRLAEVQAEINLENHNLQELDRALEDARLKSVGLQVTAQSAAQKVIMVEEEYKNVERELKNVEHELSLIKASPEEYGERMKKLETDKTDLAAQQESSAHKIKKIEVEIEEFNKKEEEKKQRVFMLQEKMQREQETVNAVLAERSELNVSLAKLETKHEDLAEEVMNDMRVSLQSIVERLVGTVGAENFLPVHNEQLQQLADTIQKLKYQLSLIGGIDEEVVAEYATTKERYDFLDGQLKDLHTATGDLKTMIEELSEIMKKKRGAAFKKIRKDFDRYFQILFGGGSADLEEVYASPAEALAEAGFEEAQNQEASFAPTEVVATAAKDKVLTGIDVIANPPGKKVKYLNMLSGGERTLTSIALICAILFNNPSPFVVLDEVEAALDEANTQRFARIMMELSTHSQFIIVTHNRVTMHAAHALYGVTMGGDGVSKLLSVKMEDLTVDKK